MSKIDSSTALYMDPTRPIKQRAADLLARMTLREKISQLGSVMVYDILDAADSPAGYSVARGAPKLVDGIGQVTRLGVYTLLTPYQRAQAANVIQDYLVHHTRLGIPAVIHEECCAGFAALGATRFPQMIGLASTFRPELAEAMGDVIRQQMRASGTHQGLAPVLDIYRDPRWGRVEETFGEDPTLVSRFGAAYIRGLQGDLREGVMATAKHFLAHSISDGGLNCTPVHVGMREVRETFLLPYEAAVRESGVGSVMHSYSEMDGAVVASSPAILRDLLRDELGFDGLLVSDYLAISMLNTFHRVAENFDAAAVQALEAGIDVELPETACYGTGLLAMAEREHGNGGCELNRLIDEAVERVLCAKFALGLFEQPFVALETVEAVYGDPKALELSREIAGQSLVLLKNEGSLLPLPAQPGGRPLTLAVIGPNADTGRSFLCDYSHASMVEVLLDGNPELRGWMDRTGSPAEFTRTLAEIPTVLEEIRARVSPETRVLYARGCDNSETDCSGFAEAVEAARQADVVLLVLGDKSGLIGGSSTGEFNDRASLGLPGVQEDLLRAVVETGKPVVLVLVNGRPLALTGAAEQAGAILECWLPGEQGGLAITDALFGAVNPGGKLPVSMPRSVGQLPVFYNHKPSGGRSHFRGDYVEMSTQPLFPFGHGLSYTRFEYADLHVDPELRTSGAVRVTCTVRNAGERAGEEVVQLYIHDEYACTPRPVKELKGFRRIHLAPGESREVTFTLSAEHLAYYDTEMQLVLEPGAVQVLVGASSEDIRLTGAFRVLGEGRMPVERRSTLVSVNVG